MKDRERRGISLGTVFMLTLTVLVLTGTGMLLPRLMGTADIDFNAVMLSALDLHHAMPELTLSDIPITDVTAVPEMTEAAATPTPVQHTPTPSPAPTASPGGTVTLTLGGSIVVDDSIRQSAYYSESKKYDFTEILDLMDEELESDITMVTLENLTDPDEKVSALNAPTDVMDMLAEHGVNVLGLGFAKALDKGHDSLKDTLTAARAMDLITVGAYGDQQEAAETVMLTIDRVNVAILHYTDSVTSAGKKFIKNNDAAWMLPQTLISGNADAVVGDILRAREAGADLVIVSVNWSGTSSFKLSTSVKNFAQRLADAGADIIVGSGTKAAQEVVWLTGKGEDGSIRHTLCAWSLGSLVTGGRNDGNVAGMLLQLKVSFDGTAISFERVNYTPTYIWRYKQEGKYQYRVVPSDLTPPDGMSEDQIGYMEKALKNIQKTLDGSPVTLRER